MEARAQNFGKNVFGFSKSENVFNFQHSVNFENDHVVSHTKNLTLNKFYWNGGV